MEFVCMSMHAYVFCYKGWLDEAWVKNLINLIITLYFLYIIIWNVKALKLSVPRSLKMDLPLQLICLRLGMCRVKDNDVFLIFCVTRGRSLLKSRIRHMHRLTADFSN